MPTLLDIVQQTSQTPAAEPSVSLPALLIAVITALGLQPYLGRIWAALISLLEGLSSIIANWVKERGVRIAVAQNQLDQNEYLFKKVEEYTAVNLKLGESNAALGSLLVEEREEYNKDRQTWKSEMDRMTQTATQRDEQISTALAAAAEYKTKYESELGLRTAAEERERIALERAERLQRQVDSLLKLQGGTINPTEGEGVKNESNSV